MATILPASASGTDAIASIPPASPSAVWHLLVAAPFVKVSLMGNRPAHDVLQRDSRVVGFADFLR